MMIEEMEEYSKSNESSLLEDQNLNDNEELEQIGIKENELISKNRIDTIPGNDIVNLEFSMPLEEIREYIALLSPKSGDTRPVKFKVKIRIQNGKVVYSEFRIDEKNEAQEEKKKKIRQLGIIFMTKNNSYKFLLKKFILFFYHHLSD